jgi:hypothetical protein
VSRTWIVIGAEAEFVAAFVEFDCAKQGAKNASIAAMNPIRSMREKNT